MKVLVTGANGMVARQAIEHCCEAGDAVVALARQELDIGDSRAVRDLFRREKFNAVLNCAAYTNVDAAESDAENCFRANSTGVENLSAAAREINAAFVTISTDYVFDGTKGDFYTQRDTPNPQGIYAKSKFAGENRAREIYARSIIVRAGWIYGTGGTNFLSVMPKLLADGKNIKAISDSYGTPTYAKNLAARLRELALLDLPGIYHVADAGAGATFAEFASKICQLLGIEGTLVEKVSMNSLERPAPRPRDSRLKCLLSEKLGLSPLPDWEKALTEFIGQ